MRFCGASKAEAVARERAGREALIAAYAVSRPFSGMPQAHTMGELVRMYRASPDGFNRLAPSTQRQWARWLDRIAADFGHIQLIHMESREATQAALKWRDELASKPRTADYAIQVLRRLLSFGCGRGLLERNCTDRIATIYRSNRSDVVIDTDELAAILQNATQSAAQAIRLAAETGMRRGDLVNLRWSDIQSDRISKRTSKSRGKTALECPLTTEARELIAELRRQRQARVDQGLPVSDHVLVTSRGTPWKPDSLTQAFERAAGKAEIKKRFHDLRGTAVTKFKQLGLSNQEIALFVGWEPGQVDRIIGRYVDFARVASDAIDRLEARRATS